MNQRRLRLLVVVAVAVVAAFALVAWRARPNAGATQELGGERQGPATTTAPTAAPATMDAASLPATTRDAGRAARDELRRKLLTAWAGSRDPGVAAQVQGDRFVPAPAGPDERMSPNYIRAVMREQLFPMVVSCYEELLVRKKKAGGRLVLDFSIVADATLGALVDDVNVEAQGDAGLDDERLVTCVRESMSTVTFQPPARGGVVTVTYPIVLAPEGDGG